MRDGEISDAAWAVIAPLLPPVGRARGRWRDHRQVLEGIVCKFRTGVPWRDLPEQFCGFDKAVYRRRNVVERCFHRLKQWRGIATRYEKHPARYQAVITLASTLIWLAQ
ncbi:transposase [Streptomyces sp. Da 82-17]|uniref:transposase n=1 Tax=Streptomyces sp. Da 82-17 TaxID=3377116 RepID=UPI0038D38CA9